MFRSDVQSVTLGMHWSAFLTGLVHRKVWKAGEIALVFGMRKLHEWQGRPFVRDTPDRRALDRDILPQLAARAECRRVAFVGCDWYTRHYEQIFAGKEYWTIEKDPARARFGGPRHVTSDLASLDAHFEPESLDLIVCNGVLGWGLHEPADIERSFSACARALRPGGVLVLGYNDVPEKMPVPIESIRALEAFAPDASFPEPISTGTYNRHTYRVLARRGSLPGA